MARLFNLLPRRRRGAERHLDREIGYHVDRRVEDLRQRGMSETEARRRATLELGGVTQVKEEVREQWMWRWADRAVRDLRIAWRSLGKHPGFSVTAILTLALGIGSTAVVMSIAEPLLIRPLPVRAPDELVLFRTIDSILPNRANNVPEELFHRLTAESSTLSDVIASNINLNPWSVAPTDPGRDPDEVIARVRMETVTGDYFQFLGVEAARGRVLAATDEAPDAPPAAVISHRLWEQSFGRDPNVVGTTIRLRQLSAYGTGAPDVTIVGIAARGFSGVDLDHRPDIWIPYRVVNILGTSLGPWGGVRLMGRLRPGTSLDAVRAETAALLPQLNERAFAIGDRGVANVAVEPGSRGYSQLRFAFSEPVLAIGAGVGLVLLIAWVNVTALMMTRGMAREREMAVRLALGSSRPGLLGSFFAEGLLLSGGGAVLGLLIGSMGIDAVAAYVPAESGLASNIALGSSVLFVTGALAVLGVVPFVLIPTIRTATATILSALTARPGISGRRPGLFQAHRITVAAQIALSLILLVGAVLFLRTLDNLRTVEAGFEESNIVEFEIETPASSTQRWVEFARSGLPMIEELPGVDVATFHVGEFRSGTVGRPVMSVFVAPGRDIRTESMGIGPAFLETTGLPLVSGRPFGVDEANASALLSESLAIELFGDSNPLGKVVYADTATLDLTLDAAYEPVARNVVGVVGDIRPDDGRNVIPMLYVPAGDMPFRIAVRTSGNPSGLIPLIREIVESFDPAFRLRGVQTLDEAREASIAKERFVAELATGLGFGALILVAVGLFGAFSYAAARRKPEVGLRIALGAGHRSVVSLMMREVYGVVLAGTAIGMVSVFLTTRLLTGMLYGVTPMDPISIVIATLALAGVSSLAAYLPVRRASRADPMVVLRHD